MYSHVLSLIKYYKLVIYFVVEVVFAIAKWEIILQE